MLRHLTIPGRDSKYAQVFAASELSHCLQGEHMNKLCTSLALAALLVVCFGSLPTTTNASDDDIAISAHMRGLGEVPPTDSKSTNSKAVAEFRGTISADGTTITYTLTNSSGSRTIPTPTTTWSRDSIPHFRHYAEQRGGSHPQAVGHGGEGEEDPA
jgi:hypothetical protein